jgi:hypothetical protein
LLRRQREPGRWHAAGSENSDQVLSGNPGQVPSVAPGQRIAGGTHSSEGKDDRQAETTRDSGTATGRPYVDRSDGCPRVASRVEKLANAAATPQGRGADDPGPARTVGSRGHGRRLAPSRSTIANAPMWMG